MTEDTEHKQAPHWTEIDRLRAKVARVEALATDGTRHLAIASIPEVRFVRVSDLRTALADPAPVEQQDDACPDCQHPRGRHYGRWCRVPMGAHNAEGSELICCCQSVDADRP